MVTISTDNESSTANPENWGRRNTAGVAIASSLLFDGISHRYDKAAILSDVTIRVEPGEILCLLGPSGSGKTTLMRIAAGIDSPGAGRLWIDNRIVASETIHVPPDKRGIGLVFQDHALFPHLTILQNVMFGLVNYPRRIAQDEARRILKRVGLESYCAWYPHQLSGGEQQRVALARALAPRPGILMLDEPFSGLDARLRDSVRDQTIGLLRDTRSTAIIVTHDPEEALRVGDRIALMREGRLVQHGTGEDLYYNPVNLFAARFFSELNLFRGRVAGGSVMTPLGRIAAPGFIDGDKIAVCVRLADIAVEAAANVGQELKQGVLGRITARRFVGIAELLEIYVEGYDEPVSARIRAGSLPAGKYDIVVYVNEGAAMMFAD
jgi:iron(III) transport system ATP-binding protein